MTDELDLSEFDLEDIVPDYGSGVEDSIAYVKRESINFRPVYALYDSNGDRLGQATTRQEAFILAEQNDLTPRDVQ